MNAALLILGIILLIYVDVQIERRKAEEYRDADTKQAKTLAKRCGVELWEKY